jgi:hypothetical protein
VCLILRPNQAKLEVFCATSCRMLDCGRCARLGVRNCQALRLTEIGHFLRYETYLRPKVEPHFSNGCLCAGGRPPCNWRRLARVMDPVTLCESFTHDELSSPLAAELITPFMA